jgi:hypothetical protein
MTVEGGSSLVTIAKAKPLEVIRPVEIDEAPRAGSILALWMALTVLLQMAFWISGARLADVSGAVEVGAARVESRGIGEVGDEVVRKAIGLQHDTTWFWTVLAMIGDFMVEPISLALRAGMVATLFGGIALLKGRSVEFSRGMAGCAAAQGFWVLSLAVRVILAIVLRRPEIETSPTLFLTPGAYPGILWVVLRQMDVFILLGWFVLARGGWKRGQVGIVGAVMVCGSLFLIEAALRVAFSLLVEAGMRLSLMPEV